VLVLGKTGRNFAAGMSGGVAYVYDEDGHFARRCNTSMVALDKVLPRDEQDSATYHKGQADEVLLKKLIDDHHRWTGSLRARHILDHWAESRAKFIKVFPHEYARVLKQMSASQAADATIAKAKTKATVPAK
jgi:glutamate synthase (NADPH) large chain